MMHLFNIAINLPPSKKLVVLATIWRSGKAAPVWTAVPKENQPPSLVAKPTILAPRSLNIPFGGTDLKLLCFADRWLTRKIAGLAEPTFVALGKS